MRQPFHEFWSHPAVAALRDRAADLALAALISIAAALVLALVVGWAITHAGLQGEALPLACIVVIVASAVMLMVRRRRASQPD